jgi:RNA polymerase sigma factor for flagellar operon FliA
VGADETRLERTIVRISTIESTSPMANLEAIDSAMLPAVLVPSEPPSPDRLFEQGQTRDRVRRALAQLPARERRIIGLYYFGEATMKQIGDAIGVNESRVSQLHARAIQRLQRLLTTPEQATPAPRLVAKTTKAKLKPVAAAPARRRLNRVDDRRAVA